jgi:O-antigen/teichoic acid export membrane protein
MTLAKRSYSRDIGGVFSSYLISLVASLGIFVILTRLLGPEDFGIYSTLLVIPLISVGLVQMGIRRAAVFHIGRKKYPLQQVVSSVFVLLILASLAGMILSWVGFRYYDNPLFQDRFIYVILITVPFKLAIVYFGGILLGTEDIRSANILNWTPLALNLVMVALLVLVVPLGIMGALLGYLISNALVAMVYAVILGKKYKIKLRIHKALIRDLVVKGFVFALSFMVIQMNLRIDLLILNRIGDAAETGYYGLAAQICEQLWLLPSAVGIVVMSRTANTDDLSVMTAQTSRLLRLTLVAGIIIAIILAIIAPPLIPLIFGQDYKETIGLIIWLLPGIISFMIFRVLNGQLSGLGRPGVSAWIFSIALVINVILNFILIPQYGATGAAWATNISYFAGSLGIIIAYIRITGISFKTLFSYSRADFDVVLQKFRQQRKNPHE